MKISAATLLAAAAVTVIAAGALYANPRGKGTFHFINSKDSRSMERLKLDANPYTAIEPVGWSIDGLFAYRYRYLQDSGSGQFWIYALAIINTADGKTAEKDSVETEAAGAGPAKERSGLSEQYKSKWNAMLKKHNIDGSVDDPLSEKFKADLRQFPVSGVHYRFDYYFNKVTEDREEGDALTVVDTVKWKLIIGSGGAQKTIADEVKVMRSSFPNDIYGRKILGYYGSPCSGRIAVIVSEYHWTPFSGGHYTVGLDVFGCSLNVPQDKGGG